MTTIERNELIVQNLSLANRIASSHFKKTPPCVQLDELQSAAYMGLVDAARKFDGSKPFEIYAAYRIFGEMKDYLRKLKWGGKNLNFKMESIDPEQFDLKTEFCLEGFEDLCKDVTEKQKEIFRLYYVSCFTLTEISTKMGLSLTRVHQLLKSGLKDMRLKQAA